MSKLVVIHFLIYYDNNKRKYKVLLLLYIPEVTVVTAITVIQINLTAIYIG